MATAAPAPQVPGLGSGQESSPSAGDRPALLNQHQIEADDDSVEVDSAFGSEIESSTTSLASSVKQYQYENGRQYHAYKSGHYAFPNDEAELDRLDLQHHIFTLTLNGRLHLAPIQSPQRIIDLGTGTGIWAIDMADSYPSAQVTGVDLSPSQPKWVPPNVQFEVDDIESPWTFKENSFDFTYARCMIGSISDWLLLFQRAFKHTKPGGWFELCEYDPRFVSDDGTLTADSYETKWSTLMCEASEKYGRPVPHYPEYKHLFEEAGFVDVHEEVFKVPSSPWPKEARLKEIGKFQHLQYLEGLKGLTIGLFTRSLQWQPEEVEVFLAHMRGELKDRSIHSYQNVVVVYGRKPQEPSKGQV